MGWRGTVRTLGAVARQAERARAHNLAALNKLQDQERASDAVREFDRYVESLISVHASCSPATNWQERAAKAPPPEPQPTHERERAARRAATSYKPSLLDRLRGCADQKRKALEDAIPAAVAADQNAFKESMKAYQQELEDHEDEVAFARKVLLRDASAMVEAIRIFEPLASIGLLGEHLSISILSSRLVQLELTIHGEEIVPKDKVKLLASGRASVKPMPKGEYHRLYQDHVCSAALRAAREILALLPVDEVLVNAVDDLVDTATGHLTRMTVLSFLAPRATLETLNFQAIDPSDAMKNFLHNMSFSATTGLKPVQAVTPPSSPH